MDIASILTQPEGKTLEFKRDLSSPRNILRTVCAFANSAGGTLVMGVSDADRIVVGVEDSLDAEERLANIISDGIAPRLALDVATVAWKDTALLVVRTGFGASPPYRVVAEGERDGAYVRIGSSNRHVDDAYLRELARSGSGRSFDSEPMPGRDPGSLDTEAIASRFSGIRVIGPAELVSLRLVTGEVGHESATVGGTLLFGREREYDFPDACIWAARFKGTTKGHFIDAKDFTGPLIDQIDMALEFIERHTTLRWEIHATRRENWWEYPMDALREAVTNAVVHADFSRTDSPIRVAVYDDRIEIENPGMLVPGLTIEDMLAGGSRTRNRVIARVFKEAGLIEQWGSGVRRMIDSCRGAGLPDPEFEEIALHFRVTIRNSRGLTPKLEPMDAKLIELLRGTDGLSTSALAALVGRTPRSVRTRVARLVESGLLTEMSSSPNDPHRRYFAAEERAPYRTRSELSKRGDY